MPVQLCYLQVALEVVVLHRVAVVAVPVRPGVVQVGQVGFLRSVVGSFVVKPLLLLLVVGGGAAAGAALVAVALVIERDDDGDELRAWDLGRVAAGGIRVTVWRWAGPANDGLELVAVPVFCDGSVDARAIDLGRVGADGIRVTVWRLV